MEMVLNIANIQGIPLVGDRKCWICGRLSRLFEVFACKSIENMDLDLTTITMWFTMPKLVVHIHVWVVSWWILVREPSVGIFPKLYANNCVWKKCKNKIK